MIFEKIAKTIRLLIEIYNITSGHPDMILPEKEIMDDLTEYVDKQLNNIGNTSETVWKRKHESAEIQHPAENIKE